MDAASDFENYVFDIVKEKEKMEVRSRFELHSSHESYFILPIIFGKVTSIMFKYSCLLILMVTIPSYAGTKKSSPGNCGSNQHWVRAHAQTAYTRGDDTAVSGSFHKAHCQNNPPAYVIWNPKLKNGSPPNWEFKNEKSKNWTDEEKEKVLEALSELPPQLLNQPVDGIYRMSESKQHEVNPASGYAHNIVIYDKAFDEGNNLARILSHEFAHEIYRQLPVAGKVDYAKAADWGVSFVGDGLNNPDFFPNRDGFVEEDGKNSIDEDFANNIEYFLFNQGTLKSKTPKVFNWISKRYSDKFSIGGKAQ